MKKFASILLIVCMIFSLSACDGNKYSEFRWPKSEISELIKQPKSNYGRVVWDDQDSFRIDVAKTSQSDYASYVDDCFDSGFNIDYYRSDSAFWADNEDGYSITLMYRKKVMTITLNSPDDLSEDPTSDESAEAVDDIGVTDSIEATPSEQNNRPEVENRTVEVGGIRFRYPGYFDVGEDDLGYYICRLYSSAVNCIASVGFQVQAVNFTKDDYLTQKDAVINMMIEAVATDGVEFLSTEDISISEQPCYILHYSNSDNSRVRLTQAVIYNNRQIIIMFLSYYDFEALDYDYIGDFYKMIETAEVLEAEPEPEPTTEPEPFQEPSESGLTEGQIAIIQDIMDRINSTDEETEPTLYYSTNTLEEAKKGNSGIFSYKRALSNYDIYWIINFNNGYAYWFIDGNGNATCERVRIDESDGDLNSYITVTYHDGNDSWQYGLCFKRAHQPDRLIQSEEDGTEYEFIATDLYDALGIVNKLEIVDY